MCVCFARIPYVSGCFSLFYYGRGVSLSLARFGWELRLCRWAFDLLKRYEFH